MTITKQTKIDKNRQNRQNKVYIEILDIKYPIL